MLKPVSVAVLFAAPVVALSACSPPGEQASSQPGTTPAIWTGSTSPSAAPGEHGSAPGAEGAAGETLTADLKTADGTSVATAEIQFADGFATVTVETTAPGKLTPGFHGLHIHSVGKCEANSVAPTGGAPGDFNSAGGHFQVAGHTGHPSSGDLSSLQIRQDGSGKLVTTTDAFTAEDLQSGAKTAIIIHEKADNFANIPPEKYQQVNGTPGPDQATMATGDAGGRVACGVIGAG
ncbi:copper/zinc superoxide dismutase [Mycolicibacterium mageritense DSM 44476 = CIP 104973]|uniref:Superoxide dismutase [Cu-Zn] n=1 Tax=Mycolicibacterium mageritense TaxID=53462 RepID=A0AAI8TVB0_MYCME|nr:superoxide dismutase family protein [Mycolicibacterium mageritense]MBN3457119.1 superoxide dismutase family protein [Mycobacterium sp. DSM 3803]OKH77243.1 superoxide dismutase [Mycobacterium sp. SWH-M3]MCC9180761.1 superoxide dismutase family protein [Mycolicibacterium mageritense]TXI58312.1 MAG: superoxide dismutase [Mycolicibacterium mageritense]CDO21034.1 copper/zinc superoxide dismutase [Mycolicibacterium mageritense DSM 44476 = CIP 104973]